VFRVSEQGQGFVLYSHQVVGEGLSLGDVGCELLEQDLLGARELVHEGLVAVHILLGVVAKARVGKPLVEATGFSLFQLRFVVKLLLHHALLRGH